MSLSQCRVEELLIELNSRGACGVVSLLVEGEGRVETWWGDRLACLGLVSRLSTTVNADIDAAESRPLVEEPAESDTEEEPPIVQPSLGMYL